jgi:hypothetical protein
MAGLPVFPAFAGGPALVSVFVFISGLGRFMPEHDQREALRLSALRPPHVRQGDLMATSTFVATRPIRLITFVEFYVAILPCEPTPTFIAAWAEALPIFTGRAWLRITSQFVPCFLVELRVGTWRRELFICPVRLAVRAPSLRHCCTRNSVLSISLVILARRAFRVSFARDRPFRSRVLKRESARRFPVSRRAMRLDD